MKLLLVQHAEAFAKSEYLDRPLTEHGALQIMQVTEFLKPMRLSVNAVWHSGKTRALQTAKVICTAVACPNRVEVHTGLNPEDDVTLIAEEIENESRDILIVGHLPFLEKLTSWLLVGNDRLSPVKFEKAAVVCLEKTPDRLWQVVWIITPTLLEATSVTFTHTA